MQGLVIDAAYPPSPAAWINDMDAIGAMGGMVYVWGPILNYSIQDVIYARSRGKVTYPIVVPGNSPGDPAVMVAACQSYGFADGPVFFDFESLSEPPNQWWRMAKSVFEQAGFIADRYGTVAVLGQYDPGDRPDWKAEWIETGTLAVIPPLSSGYSAQQFVNDLMVNGNQYDVSVLDTSLVGATGMATIDDIFNLLQSNWLMTQRGYDDPPAGSPAGTPPEHDSILLSISNTVNQLNARADAAPLVAAIKAELDAVQSAVQSGTPLDLTHVRNAIDALSTHLGQPPPP